MKHTQETIRTFLALDLDKTSKDWIEEEKKAWIKTVKGNPRWTQREGFHITLHFFGEIPATTAERIEHLLLPVASSFSSLTLQVGGIGASPNPTRPRVLWGGGREAGGSSTLQKLHAAVKQALSDEGFPVENRPFSAHITVARLKKPQPIPLERLRNHSVCPPFHVSEMVLYQSILTPQGAHYRPLKHLSFGGKQHD